MKNVKTSFDIDDILENLNTDCTLDDIKELSSCFLGIIVLWLYFESSYHLEVFR